MRLPVGRSSRRNGSLSAGSLTPAQVQSMVSGDTSSCDWGFLNDGETGEGFLLDGIVGHVAMSGVAVDGKVQRLRRADRSSPAAVLSP